MKNVMPAEIFANVYLYIVRWLNEEETHESHEMS